MGKSYCNARPQFTPTGYTSAFPFSIRSVTSTELVFVDYAGNVGKAVRTQP